MTPADQLARDQIRTRLADTLFVEAGAGTGKTTALVGRIVELVKDGVDVRRIAAITFTEAAAAELRDRVRTELELAAARGEVARAAIEEVDEAAVSTLHTFAQRLLLDHPLEAGLPPLIEVLDEIQSALAFEERWSEFVDQLLDDPAYETVLLRGFATGLRLEALKGVALALRDHRDRLDAAATPPPPAGPVDVTLVLDTLRTALALAESCTDPADLLALHLDTIDSVRTRLEGATDELEVLHVLDAARQFASGTGKAPNWTGCPVDEVRAACTVAEDARRGLLAGVRREVLAHLVHAVERFTLACADERRAQGRLDFHDLLVEARDLLRNRPEVRRALRQRFSHLLIDEFQDTDPIQVELAVLLAADADLAPDGTWRDLDIEPGRLFFVGDAKQSIYRFRRADIALFLEVERLLVDAPVQLTTNFRSTPGVLAWVNAVFGPLLGEGVEGAQAAYEPLHPHRPAIDGAPSPPVVLLGGPDDRKVGDVRDTEAADIADAVFRIVEQEQWPVTDPGDGTVRPASYRDIAILLPSRISLPHLEAALDDAEVPYRVESASLVWGTQEIRDVLSVLRAIDDPTDEVALVAALRSPLLACSDRDLFQYRRAGGRWRLTSPPPDSLPVHHPVRDALGVLLELHRQRWWEGVAGMVARVVRDLRCHELAFARARPRDQWRRLRFVVDQARAFQEAGGRTLREFVAWAELQGADDARVREPVLPESDDDAVRILTVHGAKGLEFPITILSGLNRTGTHGGGAARVFWDAERPEVRMGRFETPGFDAVNTAEQRLSKLEQDRLLYVAATRAQDHLVVCLHHKTGTQCHAAMLHAHAQEIPELARSLGPPLFRMSAPRSGAKPRPQVDGPGTRQRWAAQREHLLATRRRVPVFAATAIADAAKEEPEPDAPFFRRGRAGTSIGRAVHATLQSVDLATGEGLDGIAAAQAAAEGVDAAATEVATLARAALGSATVQAAVARRHWREIYVAAPIGAATIEGFVDLVYEDDDGRLVVVDYKTDAVRTAADADASLQRYRLQVATYALVLETALDRQVASCVLLFVAGGIVRERVVTDLDAAKLEVRRMVETSEAEMVPS